MDIFLAIFISLVVGIPSSSIDSLLRSKNNGGFKSVESYNRFFTQWQSRLSIILILIAGPIVQNCSWFISASVLPILVLLSSISIFIWYLGLGDPLLAGRNESMAKITVIFSSLLRVGKYVIFDIIKANYLSVSGVGKEVRACDPVVCKFAKILTGLIYADEAKELLPIVLLLNGFVSFFWLGANGLISRRYPALSQNTENKDSKIEKK